MATIPRQEMGQGGLEPSFAAAANGDKIKAGPGVFLAVRNTNGATRDVTLNDVKSKNPGSAVAFNPDVTVTVDATTGETWIPVPDRFADPDDGGLCAITYSALTGVTVAAVRVAAV